MIQKISVKTNVHLIRVIIIQPGCGCDHRQHSTRCCMKVSPYITDTVCHCFVGLSLMFTYLCMYAPKVYMVIHQVHALLQVMATP